MDVHFKSALLLSSALIAFGATPVRAQQTGEEQGDEATNQVGMIIVTAQRREENSQDVPVAVTAVSQQQLQVANITSVTDLPTVAPSLRSTASNGIYLANSIRGVGSFGYGAGVESPVALYVDGVYQAAPFSFSTQLNSVEAVEVLKGPQGTLFGRNATGGLINVRTRTPTDTRGNIELGYGDHDTWTGRAYLSGGFSDSLAADISFFGESQGDGYGRNITTGKDWNRKNHNYTVRSKWHWSAGDSTEVTLSGDYFAGSGTSGGAVGVPGTFAGLSGQVMPDLGYGADVDKQLVRSVDGGGLSLEVSHDFGGVTAKSITAWRRSTYNLEQDIDFTPAALALIEYDQDDRQFSQEFQLSSDDKGPFKWTAGLFYYDAKADVDFTVDLLGLAGIRLNFLDRITSESWAGYGQGTYAIGDSTNLTLGIRYTHERRGESNAYSDIDFGPGSGSIPAPGVIPSRSFGEGEVTWRASIDHRFSPELMWYASFNTGFKSGGYNSTLPGAAPYRAETITAYETGFKSDILDRRLRLNVAGFYYDYKDIQVQTLQNNSLFVINGPKAKIYGLDADFTAVLADGLEFSGGATWLHNKFGDFPGCPVSSPAGGVPLNTVGTNCADNHVPMASDFSFSGALTYSTDLGDGKLTTSANLYYNNGYFFEADNVLKQGGFALLGGSVRYEFESGPFVSVWTKNLTDKRIAGFSTHTADGTAVVVWQDPRTFGVTAGFKF